MAEKKTQTTKNKHKRVRKGSIGGQMYTIAILPVILFALVITIAGIPFLSGIMHDMAEKSLYDTGMTAAYGDDIITLSTCDYEKDAERFVVVAKRVK